MSETPTAAAKPLSVVSNGGIVHKKPPVDLASLTHRQLRSDEFWRQIPGWKDVDEATFLSHVWQEKHAIISPEKLV